jgi:hypothetical protein
MAIVKAENVLDQWQETLPSGGDMAQVYMDDVWSRVYEMSLPVDIAYEEASTGLIRQALGQSRKFLVMNPQDKTLNVFRILLYSIPMGNALTVGWFATDYSRKLGTSSGLRVPLINDLDLFANADLMGLFSAIHEWAVLPATVTLAQKFQLETSVTRKSKAGMFGVG